MCFNLDDVSRKYLLCSYGGKGEFDLRFVGGVCALYDENISRVFDSVAGDDFLSFLGFEFAVEFYEALADEVFGFASANGQPFDL